MQLTREGKDLYEYVDKSLSILETGEKTVNEKEDFSTSKIIIGSLSQILLLFI